MKRIHEIGVYKSGNLRVEVVDLSDVEETLNENTAVFVGHTTVTSRIEGQDFSDFYQISRAYLKQQAQWRVVASQSTRVATTPASVVNYVRDAFTYLFLTRFLKSDSVATETWEDEGGKYAKCA